MADGVAITAGSGTTIATDDAGAAGHVQIVKLAQSADGSASPIAADANGLDVDVTRTFPNRTASGTLGALNAEVVLAVDGCGTAAVWIEEAVLVGTVSFFLSADGGTNWWSVNRIYPDNTATIAQSVNGATGGLVLIPVAGATHVRARVTAYTSGSATCNIAASAGTSVVQLGNSLPTGTNNIGDVDVLTVPAPLSTAGNGTAATAHRVTIASDSTGQVRLAANSGVDIGDVDVTSLPNVTLAAGTNTNEVVGDVGHDVAIGGNPIVTGAVTIDTDDTAPPNRASAEARAVRVGADRDGAVFVRPHGPQMWSTVNTGSLSNTSVKGAPGAGLSLYVTAIQFSIGAATASSIKLTISGGADIFGPHYLEAVNGRGISIAFNPPLKVTANTALVATTTGATTCTLNTQGYTSAG